MEQKHRDIIQKNFSSLVERTDLDLMVDKLYEKGVFSERMIEPYKDTNKDVRQRKRELYMDVKRRGPYAFKNLVETLFELGYWNIVEDLDPENPLIRRRPQRNNHYESKRISESYPRDGYLSITDEKKKHLPSGASKQESTHLGSAAPAAPSPKTPAPPAVDAAPPAAVPTAPTVSTTSTPPAVAPAPPASGDSDLPNFKVIKSTRFIEDSESDVKLYRTRGPQRQRGVLVVFSYSEFQHNVESPRGGSDVDCKNLKYLFSEFGFRAIAFPNLTRQETLNTLESLKGALVGKECVFIVVSSHGYARRSSSDTDFRCSDGLLLSYQDIVHRFNNKNFPELCGVPKVFIFQICRGNKGEMLADGVGGVGGVGDASQPDGTPLPPAPAPPERAAAAQPLSKRHCSDILIAHSTLPGYVSWRDPQKGSWYIQVMCEVFAAHAHDTHVETLFTLVDDELHRRFSVQTSSVDRWGFNNRLYLHPGLFGE